MRDQVTRFRTPPLAAGLPRAGAGNLGMRRSIFLEAGGFDPAAAFVENTDLCARIRRAGYEPVRVPELVMHAWPRGTAGEVFRRALAQGARLADLARRGASTGTGGATSGGYPPAPQVMDWVGVGDPIDGAARATGPTETAWRVGRDLGRRSRPLGRATREPTKDDVRSARGSEVPPVGVG
jgi:hypothetical protein